ncbi:Cytosolic phospholipase A2 [Branchiostoma belcheri]|nr:Cytosolic phospholipase A2 [Branchiostoma belcheri]
MPGELAARKNSLPRLKDDKKYSLANQPPWFHTPNSFDPFQLFEVEHRPCLMLHVTVLRGRNITKGWAGDLASSRSLVEANFSLPRCPALPWLDRSPFCPPAERNPPSPTPRGAPIRPAGVARRVMPSPWRRLRTSTVPLKLHRAKEGKRRTRHIVDIPDPYVALKLYGAIEGKHNISLRLDLECSKISSLCPPPTVDIPDPYVALKLHGAIEGKLDIPDPYVALKLHGVIEGKRRTRHIDNDVNPEWDESFTFLLDSNQKYSLDITWNVLTCLPFLCPPPTVDIPDPYVALKLHGAIEGKRRTRHIDNDVNPEWDESFTFLLDSNQKYSLDITLWDANYTIDESLGTVTYELDGFRVFDARTETFRFYSTSEVDIKFETELNQHPDLRYSLALCDEEKNFMVARKKRVGYAIRDLVGEERGPRHYKEVPRVAILGSGGGFRAMIGMAGAVKALSASCYCPVTVLLLTCSRAVPRVAILGSGGGFRAMIGMAGAVKALSDAKVLDCATYLVGLSGSSWYISTLYSHKDWPKATPGELQEELKHHVDSSLFYLLKPRLLYRYTDAIMRKRTVGQPVSFTDFFGHLVGETLIKDRLDFKLSDMQEKIRDGQAPMPLITCVHVRHDVAALVFHEWVEFTPYEVGMAKYGTFMRTELFGSKFFMGCLAKRFPEAPLHFLMGIWGSAFTILFNRLMMEKKSEPEDLQKELEETLARDARREKAEKKKLERTNSILDDDSDSDDDEFCQQSTADGRQKKPSQTGFYNNWLMSIFTGSSLFATREGRAGKVHNFMRGLSLNNTYPISPFTPPPIRRQAYALPNQSIATEDEFDGIHEPLNVEEKKLYMVDGGLTFNSPYPAVLRPQRDVDLILSYDFSARTSDSSRPFRELLLAEKWARINGVPFPPIDTSVFDREGMKECYVFKHPTDDKCPIVLHFVLVNIEFRKFKKPGVKRETEEELEFANFDLFDDPNTPFSTFNFCYPHKAFDQLAQLMEFNTLQSLDIIKDNMAECVQRRRRGGPRPNLDLADVKRNSFKNSKKKLRQLIRTFSIDSDT